MIYDHSKNPSMWNLLGPLRLTANTLFQVPQFPNFDKTVVAFIFYLRPSTFCRIVHNDVFCSVDFGVLGETDS